MGAAGVLMAWGAAWVDAQHAFTSDWEAEGYPRGSKRAALRLHKTMETSGADSR